MSKGDFNPGNTIVQRFNSHKADGTPITLAGTPAISVYKNSTTESTSGVTLTVDYDGRTGLNHVAIDTSSDGTFYAAGNDFDIVITAGTVDSISVVGSVVGGFSLGNRSALRPTTAGRTLDVSAGGEAGIDWANIGSPTTTVNLSGTTVKTVTDVISALPVNFAAMAITINGVVTASLADDAVNANSVATSAVTEIQSGLATALVVAAIKAKTDNLPSDPADASDIAASFASVESALATIDGRIDTEIPAIKAKTDLIPAAPASTSDIPGASTVATAVWANGTRSLTDKAGFNLASTGLDQISAAEPTGLATTFREKLVQTWARFFRKAERTSTQIKVYQSDGATVATTQSWTDSGGTETVGGAS